MKSFFQSILVLPLLFACGRPPAKQIINSLPAPSPAPVVVASPTPSPTTPVPSPTPTPVNNGLKWSNTQLSNEVTRCKSNTDTSYTKEQWASLCSCVYQYAAKTWDYTDYKNNYTTYIQNMGDDGTLEGCMREAGML